MAMAVAVAVAWASSNSADWTPSPEASVCLGCSPKKKKKKRPKNPPKNAGLQTQNPMLSIPLDTDKCTRAPQVVRSGAELILETSLYPKPSS